MKRKNVKIRNIIGLLALLILSNVGYVFAASGNMTFSGTLSERVLDGSKNGVYYSIPADHNVSLKGTAKITYTMPGIVAPVNSINVHLYREGFLGISDEICSTTIDMNSSVESFECSGTTTQTSNKYYIMSWRGSNDGRTVEISGTLSYWQ